MARGGKREGAGRKKGSKGKRSSKVAKEAAKRGITPLEYMLRVMRNSKADTARRDDMAKAAAPFIHPRINTIQHTGKDGEPIRVTFTSLDAGTL